MPYFAAFDSIEAELELGKRRLWIFPLYLLYHLTHFFFLYFCQVYNIIVEDKRQILSLVRYTSDLQEFDEKVGAIDLHFQHNALLHQN